MTCFLTFVAATVFAEIITWFPSSVCECGKLHSLFPETKFHLVFLTQVASGSACYQEYKYFYSLHLGFGILRSTVLKHRWTASLTGDVGARRPLHRCWSPRPAGPSQRLRWGPERRTPPALQQQDPTPPAWKKMRELGRGLLHTIEQKKEHTVGLKEGENVKWAGQSVKLFLLGERCSCLLCAFKAEVKRLPFSAVVSSFLTVLDPLVAIILLRRLVAGLIRDLPFLASL